MDINDLKNIWQDSFKDLKGEQLSPKDIEERLAIKGKTESLISRIKKNLIFEILFTILLLTVTGIYVSPEIKGQKEWTIFGILILFVFILLLNVYHKYYHLKKIRIYENNLKVAIKKMLDISEKYIRFNTGRVGKYIILPLAILIGLGLGLVLGHGSSDVFTKLTEISTTKLILLAVSVLFLYGMSILLTIWINKRLYGKYVSELKQCLKELSQIEENGFESIKNQE